MSRRRKETQQQFTICFSGWPCSSSGRASWQGLKDFIRSRFKTEPGWTDFRPSGSGERGGVMTIRDRQKAEEIYEYFCSHPVNGQRLNMTLSDTSDSHKQYLLHSTHAETSRDRTRQPSGFSPGSFPDSSRQQSALMYADSTAYHAPVVFLVAPRPPTMPPYQPPPRSAYSTVGRAEHSPGYPHPPYASTPRSLPLTVHAGLGLVPLGGSNVFVKSLHPDTSTDSLKQLLATCGTLTHLQLQRRGGGPEHGSRRARRLTATASFAKATEARYAVHALHEQLWNGRPLHVELARDQDPVRPVQRPQESGYACCAAAAAPPYKPREAEREPMREEREPIVVRGSGTNERRSWSL